MQNLAWQATCYNVTVRRFRPDIVPVEKAVSIAYSEIMFVDLGMWHETRMLHIVTCGLPASIILFHIIS